MNVQEFLRLKIGDWVSHEFHANMAIMARVMAFYSLENSDGGVDIDDSFQLHESAVGTGVKPDASTSYLAFRVGVVVERPDCLLMDDDVYFQHYPNLVRILPRKKVLLWSAIGTSFCNANHTSESRGRYLDVIQAYRRSRGLPRLNDSDWTEDDLLKECRRLGLNQ